ncbi:MAG TPA: fibronectin type III domain-containing protein [Tepidisphaeraceae bacterium]|nr:fibronectin type III domain-containing protein [Tepidisphaeraceae bacterium]
MTRHPLVRFPKFHRALSKRNSCQRRFWAEALESRQLLTAVDVLSYHNDSSSTGANLMETALTPANVNTSSFGKFFSTPLDGQAYGQPLYDAGVNITAGNQPGVHNVVYSATEHDSLYAIDADTGTILWQDSFLVPEPALQALGAVTVTTVPNSDLGSADIQPEIGITSTPAIDPATGFLFLTAKTKQIVNGNSGAPHYVYTLYKVNIQSGAYTGTVIGDTTFSSGAYTYNSGPYVLDPAGHGAGVVNVGGQNEIIFNALRQMNRSAVTLYNGNLYLGFASHGDNGPYHGWILGYSENSLAPTAVFNANPDGSDGGIWMAGNKIAIDPQGFMYVMTGNGTFDTTMDANGFPINGDYGDSFIKIALDPTTSATNQNINGWGLKVVDYFTPFNQANLSSGDQDLGSGGVLILPETAGSINLGLTTNQDLLVGAGKQGMIYLIDRNNMGKYNPNTTGPDHVVNELLGLSGGGAYDTPAFYYDGTSARIYFVQVDNKARSFTIANGIITADTVSADGFGHRDATFSVSANGATNGIAWAIDPGELGAGQLRAYNASNLAQEYWTSAQAAGSRDALPTGVKFSTPTITNGQVFVGTNNSLVAYGEFPAQTSPPAAPDNLVATALAGTQVGLVWQDHADNESRFLIEDSTNGGTSWTQVATAATNATSYALGGLTPGTSYSFRVRATNAVGNSGYTNVATAATIPLTPAIDFSGGFAGASGLTFNGTAAKIVGSSLQLTDANNNEASSIFTSSTVNVQRFITSFTFQQTNPNADGMTFTIQNVAPTTVGGAGGSLGYGPTSGTTGGIASSVALKFDLFSNNGEGTDSTGLFTNGAAPTNAGSVDMTPSFLNLHTGDVMLVTLSYDGATLQETITDTISHVTFSHNYSINIPSTVGASSAYIGFTGGTGGQNAIQDVLTWSYTPLPSDFILGTPANDTVTLTEDPDAQHIDWTIGTSPQQMMLINDPNGLTLYGNGGNDTVTLVYTHGNPLPNLVYVNSGNGNFTINGLQGTAPLTGTTIDIEKSTVFINYAAGPSPLSLIQSYLANGYNGGTWTGTNAMGVISSSAAAANHTAGISTTAIGYADFADGQGVNTNSNTIELRYTLYGDANLDGQVNSADLQILLAFLNRTGAWDQGDFNYDGQVNSADLQNLLFTLNTALGNQSTPLAIAAASAAPSTAPSTSVSSKSASTPPTQNPLTSPSASALHAALAPKPTHRRPTGHHR